LKAGQIYGFRVHGPFDPSKGCRFDSGKVLLDPYGRAVVVPSGYNRTAAHEKGDNAGTAMKSVVVDPTAYDWGGDRPLHRPSSQTIVYEMHVRGFTKHANSGLREHMRGTYAGVIEKISVLETAGNHGRRVITRFSVRCPRRACRTYQLLGLCAGVVLRAARGVQLSSGSIGTGRRVP
jgi:glycogen operon protein